MTNMSLATRDKSMLKISTKALLERRRQLCPWSLDVEETERLYIPRNVWDVGQQIKGMDMGRLLFHDSNMHLSVENYIVGKKIAIHVQANVDFWTPQWVLNSRTAAAVRGTPDWEMFTGWLDAAIQVKVENEVIGDTMISIINECTTYKQLAKITPQALLAVSSHNTNAAANNARSHYGHYGYEAQNKLADVMKELDLDTKTRAKVMPEAIRSQVAKYRTLLETTFASAVLLPDHGGLEKGSTFDRTWITSRITDRHIL